jgi:hypothetical protein
MADENQAPPAVPPINGEQADPFAAMKAARADWDPKLVLFKPLDLAGEKITELKFRQPRGKDIEEIGLPLLPLSTRMDPMVMGEMMARLAAVPPSTIKALDSQDWIAGAYKVMYFFTPGRAV